MDMKKKKVLFYSYTNNREGLTMSFFGNLGKKVVEKASDLAAKVDGGRDYVAAAANNLNSLVKRKDPR